MEKELVSRHAKGFLRFCPRGTRNSAFLFLLGLILTGDVHATSTQVTPSPEQIKETLLQGAEADVAKLAATLELAVPRRAAPNAKKDLTCTSFDSVERSDVPLLKSGTQTVLVIRDTFCQYTFVVVLQKGARGAWSTVKTIPLLSKYEEPKVTFESLIEPGAKEIVVRNYVSDAGTGILEATMMVFKLFTQGLEVVFDRPERVTFNIPLSSPDLTSDQTEESSFTFVESEPERSSVSLKEILQKQVIRDHKTIIVRWWNHIWIPELQRFEPRPTSERSKP